MALPLARWSSEVLLLIALAYHALALQTSHGDSSKTSQNFKIHDSGGLFGGTEFLADALGKDLPSYLQRRLDGCGVYMRGDWKDPRKHGANDWHDQGRVWILVNGESFWGDAIHDTALAWLGPNDKLVVLGNWYNESTAEVTDDRMSSLWVPYASLYFADRLDRTPLDLLHGRARKATRSVQRSVDAERIVAYLHRHCEERREVTWDILNEELRAKTGHVGSALGLCNGNKHLGKRVRDLVKVETELDSMGHLHQVDKPHYISEVDGFYDTGEQMFQDFLFAMAVENEPNGVGYISEKIVNTYLSGTVPIYNGATQIDSIFNTKSFLRVNSSLTTQISSLLQDESAYESLRQPVGGVVSDETLRTFFSWHPAVWPSHGDHLRRRILDEVARLCLEIELQPALEKN